MTSLTAYLDASGTQLRDGVYAVAGFIATDEQWSRFAEDWRGILRAAGIKRFHMTDLEAMASEFSEWTREDRERLLNRLLHTISSNTMASVAYAVSHDMYSENIPNDVHRLVKSPYYFLFLNIVVSTDWLMDHVIHYTTFDPRYEISYVLAQGDEGTGIIANTWMSPARAAMEARTGSRIRAVSVATDNTRYSGLEAADLLAFEARKQVQLQLRQHSRSPRYPLRMIENNGNPRRWNFYQHPYHLRFNADVIERTVLGKPADSLLTWDSAGNDRA